MTVSACPHAAARGGLPAPLAGVCLTSPASSLDELHRFETTIEAEANALCYYQNFHTAYPVAAVDAIAAAGMHQMLTVQPSTAQIDIRGWIRAKDDGVDSEIVSGSTYHGIVAGASLFCNRVDQPAGTVVVLGGLSGNASAHVTLVEHVRSGVPSGSAVTTTSFTLNERVPARCYLFDFAGMALGHYDDVIGKWALTAGGSRTTVRFAHEMNGGWYGWGMQHGGSGLTPSGYRSLWHYWRSVWRAHEDAHRLDHAAWVWSPNVTGSVGETPADSGRAMVGAERGSACPLYPPDRPGGGRGTRSCYPGDDAVEYVGLDGFARLSSGDFRSAETLFDRDVRWIRSAITHRRQILIAETGADRNLGARRGPWIDGLFTYTRHARLLGAFYFNNHNYAVTLDPATSCFLGRHFRSLANT